MVLGMHRSGTSAFSRVLSLLGCDLPRNVVDAGHGNEKGHWEPQRVVDLNERIFQTCGSYLHDWLAIPAGLLASPQYETFREQARLIVDEEYRGSRLAVLKDPRICRLFPFWADALKDGGIEPLVVVPVRNPLEVSASLLRRDRFDTSWGNLLWLRNVIEAERDSRGYPRFFTSYERLLDDWQAVASAAATALEVEWPNPIADVTQEVGAFLTKEDRHHSKDPREVLSNQRLSPWMRDVYAIMLKWASQGEDEADFPILDRIRSEMELAAPAFAGVITAGWESALWARDMNNRRVSLQLDFEKSRRLGEARLASIRNLEEELSETRRLFATASAELSEARTTRVEFARQLDTADFAIRDLRQRLRVMETGKEACERACQQLSNQVEKLRESVRKNRIAAIEQRHRFVMAIAGEVELSLVPKRLAQRIQRAILARSGLFDAEWYAAYYSDVAASRLDPLDHFIRFGAKEGRLWGPQIAGLTQGK